jgi:DNA-binding winged helix-turn-helix (wHTH) protein
MKYRFTTYIFDDELRQLTGRDFSARRLRPKLKELLVILLKRDRKVVRKHELIEEIWGANSNATDHDLHNLKRELEKVLGTKRLIKSVPGEGYVFDAPVSNQIESDIGTKIEEESELTILPIFPGAGTPAGALFVHSFVGYGKNDHVRHIERRVKWERHPRHMVMLSNTSRSAFTIPFRHVVKPGREGESWWSVVIPVRVNSVSGDWQAVDLTRYRTLSFKARGKPMRPKHAQSLLRIRFEDNSRKSASRSGRQSSSWYPEALNLGVRFHPFTLDLDKFKWSVDAWPDNNEPVCREKIIQIVFGQDTSVPSAEGLIEVRDVALSA